MAHNVEIVKIQQEYYLSDKSRKMTALMVQSFQRININPPTTLFQNTFSDVWDIETIRGTEADKFNNAQHNHVFHTINTTKKINHCRISYW